VDWIVEFTVLARLSIRVAPTPEKDCAIGEEHGGVIAPGGQQKSRSADDGLRMLEIPEFGGVQWRALSGDAAHHEHSSIG